ncbi:MAG: [protein-PII] uridylyltransferase [Verrucomicrobiales bacterium]
MLSLAEKIEVDASARLELPPDRQPGQELARYKAFLKLENHRLHMLHKAGASGMDVCHARATLLDVLLKYILAAVENNLKNDKTAIPRFALVAIGGYGRGQLNPFSDIDIMFLHESDMVTGGKARPQLKALTDGLLYTLWDLGMKVGHSVRSIDDAVIAANSDMQSKTALIEARLVTGEAALFQRFQASLVAKCVRGFEEDYLAARMQDQAARRAKFGNSASMQEPNIKNGCGGLRDYQNLLWMAYFKHRTKSLEELQKRDFISEAEQKHLEAAYDFLLWVRNEMHYTAKRAVDVLGKNIQPTVASNLGYTERSPSKRLEHFMRDVYTHMRNIFLITRTLEQRLALAPVPKGLASLRNLFKLKRNKPKEIVVDGFKIADGEIQESTRSFKEQPRRLMRVFLHAQQRGVRLHPDLAQAIRNQLQLVNREFLEDSHVRETFLEILNQRGNVAPVLRAMHEVGLLGKYIPEFGRLTCLVQHEFYHQYTADEHTLVCIEKLDQVWEAKEPPYHNYGELFQQVERPFILYLALLLHDAGKGFPRGNHAEVGGTLAMKVARRLALDGATTHHLRLLIENHLTMIQVSQRRDLDDPSVIRNFASIVQTRENLVMLTLHTFADSQGTSDQLWNGFKDTLLWTLYHKTRALFAGGNELTQAEQREIELIAEEVRGMLPPTFSRDEIEAHFSNLPPRYFQIHSSRQIVSDVTLAHRFMHLQLAEEDKALEPVVTWHNEPDRGYTSVHICTWDRAGLFIKIAGSLTAAGLNILTAQIFTRSDGIILDTFYVTDAKNGGLASKEAKEKFEKILNESLTGDVDFAALIGKIKNTSKLYQSIEGERMPIHISVDNATSDTHTIIDIETEDRVGLLFFVSQAFVDLGIDIALARISTERGAAVDTFYITTSIEKEKVTDPDLLAEIQARLQEALAAPAGK